MSGVAVTESTAAFDAELAALHIEGHWKTNEAGLPTEPGGQARPFLWRWTEVYPKVLKAGELLSNDAGASRRTLRLCTPGLPGKATARTIHTSIQMVKPGEVAKLHRHSISAFRFVIAGSGGVTTVDGHRFTMERNDLVLTPQWSWHEHSNDAAEPMIWIDGHDMPLMRALDTIFFQSPNAHNRGPLLEENESVSSETRTRPHIYKGEQSIAALRALGSEAWTPFDGRVFEYHNPLTGGPTMPTIQCRLHLFEADEATTRRRHTASTIYHVIEGHGTTTVGDATLEWRPGDIFVVPNWLWHSHRVARRGPAILFSVTDEPVLAALGHLRSESMSTTRAQSPVHGERRHG